MPSSDARTVTIRHDQLMIVVDHLHKRRGTTEVLTDVSFTARAGRVTVLLGPNGAGKSSTIRILLGLDYADQGSAHIDGVPYRELFRPLRHVGAMLGGAGAHPSSKGRAHLRWLAASNSIDRARVEQVLHDVGLTEAADKRVRSYSSGMRQRLGLAGALLGEPPVLVLDEPGNGLDPDGMRWMRSLVRAHVDRGGTVLLCSHLLVETALTADDAVIMANGRVAYHGPMSTLTSTHRSLEAAFFSLTTQGP